MDLKGPSILNINFKYPKLKADYSSIESVINNYDRFLFSFNYLKNLIREEDSLGRFYSKYEIINFSPLSEELEFSPDYLSCELQISAFSKTKEEEKRKIFPPPIGLENKRGYLIIDINYKENFIKRLYIEDPKEFFQHPYFVDYVPEDDPEEYLKTLESILGKEILEIWKNE